MMLIMLADKPDAGNGPWSAIPSILWVVVVFIALIALRRELQVLLRTLSWRLRTGTAVKLFSFELGQSYAPQQINASKQQSRLEHRPDEDGSRWKERERYYLPNRNIHIVHRLTPSMEPGMLYDIQLYLVPHREATLSNVSKVEYYFGRNWGNQIFTSIDRAQGFPITTSAYGPFMCLALIFFTDGQTVFVNRYVDFEMGSIGTLSDRDASGPTRETSSNKKA